MFPVAAGGPRINGMPSNDGEGPARPIVPIGAAASSGSGIPHGTLADTLPDTASPASCGDTDIDTDSDADHSDHAAADTGELAMAAADQGMDSTHMAAAASGARAASETAAASGAAVAAAASETAAASTHMTGGPGAGPGPHSESPIASAGAACSSSSAVEPPQQDHPNHQHVFPQTPLEQLTAAERDERLRISLNSLENPHLSRARRAQIDQEIEDLMFFEPEHRSSPKRQKTSGPSLEQLLLQESEEPVATLARDFDLEAEGLAAAASAASAASAAPAAPAAPSDHDQYLEALLEPEPLAQRINRVSWEMERERREAKERLRRW